MGTINFGTSDIITVGTRMYSFTPEEVEEYNVEMADCNPGLDIEYTERDVIDDCYDCDRGNAGYYYEKHNMDNLSFFSVTIEPGYYEGFYIRIKKECIYYENAKERSEAEKELTRIKHFLIDCVSVGLAVCFPGWCTSYVDEYADNVKAISDAIKEAKEGNRNTPTYTALRRNNVDIVKYIATH